MRWTKRDGQDRVATAAQVVAYIDARTVVARLNLLFPGRWHAPTDALPLEMRLTRRDADGTLTPIRVTDQGEVKADDTLYYRCRLAIGDAAFEDVGAGDDPKAAYSDAIKRAAVRAGIGESLYAMDAPWLRVGDAEHQLRVSRAGKPYLDERTTRWLRSMYEAWLTRAGAIFGEPLPHAPAPTLPGASETPTDDPHTAGAAPRRRRRARRQPHRRHPARDPRHPRRAGRRRRPGRPGRTRRRERRAPPTRRQRRRAAHGRRRAVDRRDRQDAQPARRAARRAHARNRPEARGPRRQARRRARPPRRAGPHRRLGRRHARRHGREGAALRAPPHARPAPQGVPRPPRPARDRSDRSAPSRPRRRPPDPRAVTAGACRSGQATRSRRAGEIAELPSRIGTTLAGRGRSRSWRSARRGPARRRHQALCRQRIERPRRLAAPGLSWR